jgi:hypothetical protein
MISWHTSSIPKEDVSSRPLYCYRGILSPNNQYNIYYTKYSGLSPCLLLLIFPDYISYSIRIRAYHSSSSVQGCTLDYSLYGNTLEVRYLYTSYPTNDSTSPDYPGSR